MRSTMPSMSQAKMDPKPLPKRFYAVATMEMAEAGGYGITLDTKPLRTPAKRLLHTLSQPLAQEIAAEWNAQGTHIRTDTMPLTRLLSIALDRVPTDREALLQEIARYGETDLLCYRAPGDGGDNTLRALQAQYFNPILAWAETTHGLSFQVTEGLLPIDQPPESLAKLAALFATATEHELAALAMLVPILGSALLTLALWQGEINIDTALTAARLDEAVQEKKWGADPEKTTAWKNKCRDARACAFFLTAS